jgi:hypothetical protein
MHRKAHVRISKGGAGHNSPLRPYQIETDLKEILGELKNGQKEILNKVEAIDKKVIEIDKTLVKVETKLESELPTLQKNIDEIKGSQKAHRPVGGFLRHRDGARSANLDVNRNSDYCRWWFYRGGGSFRSYIQSLISLQLGWVDFFLAYLYNNKSEQDPFFDSNQSLIDYLNCQPLI